MYWNNFFLMCPTSEFIPKLIFFFTPVMAHIYIEKSAHEISEYIHLVLLIIVFCFCLQSKIDTTNIVLDYILNGLIDTI